MDFTSSAHNNLNDIQIYDKNTSPQVIIDGTTAASCNHRLRFVPQRSRVVWCKVYMFLLTVGCVHQPACCMYVCALFIIITLLIIPRIILSAWLFLSPIFSCECTPIAHINPSCGTNATIYHVVYLLVSIETKSLACPTLRVGTRISRLWSPCRIPYFVGAHVILDTVAILTVVGFDSHRINLG